MCSCAAREEKILMHTGWLLSILRIPCSWFQQLPWKAAPRGSWGGGLCWVSYSTTACFRSVPFALPHTCSSSKGASFLHLPFYFQVDKEHYTPFHPLRWLWYSHRSSGMHMAFHMRRSFSVLNVRNSSLVHLGTFGEFPSSWREWSIMWISDLSRALDLSR